MYECICVCVCMCVCMYVCMYVISYVLVMCLSTMVSEPKTILLLNDRFLTSNAQATKKKFEFFKLCVYGKGVSVL